MLKKIGSTARYEIERLLGCKVNLKLWVKVPRKLARRRLSYEKFRIQRGPEGNINAAVIASKNFL